MATYNEIAVELKCPRCGQAASMVVDLYFGYRDQIKYSIGDVVAWHAGRAVQNGGRPADGELDGEGYAECPACKKDFFVVVEIRDDRLVRVRPDLQKKPWIPD